MPNGGRLEPGLYESPITRRIEEVLAVLGDVADTAGIESADAHVLLTRHLAGHIANALQAAPDVKAKVELANAILGSVEELTGGHQDLAPETISEAARELRAVRVRTGVGRRGHLHDRRLH